MSTTESRFVELVRSWLVSLPHDLKIAFEAMDDENLPREGRELATGAVIYVVSPNDFVSDRNEAVSSYVDDVILLRLALLELVTSGDEDAAALRDRFPSLFDGLEDDLQLCREMMGDLMAWLDGKVADLANVHFHYDPGNIMAPWRIYTDDGTVELEFQPLGERVEDLDLKLIVSRFHQPFGRFRGTLRGAGGEVHELDDVFGVTEEHFARW